MILTADEFQELARVLEQASQVNAKLKQLMRRIPISDERTPRCPTCFSELPWMGGHEQQMGASVTVPSAGNVGSSKVRD